MESKHMLRTLLFLLENGRSKKIDLYCAVSKNPRMPDKLDALTELGLITTDREGKGSVVELTQRGKDIAEHIRSIEDLL